MNQGGLLPMELTECVTDSPFFRDTLHSYEKELDSTNSAIKFLIKLIKELLAAARRLSECQRAFASAMDSFPFACIGSTQTDDETVITSSLRRFAYLVNIIETERERMLDNECNQFVSSLERFRSTHISKAKDDRKKFEKQTQKFCSSLERHLNMSTKKMEDHAVKEADASLEMEQRCFVQTSMNYVCQLQEIEQRKKFDFVETLLTFVYGWLTFYHQGYEVAEDWKPFMNDLQTRMQKTREEFDETRTKVETLKNKTLEDRQTKSSVFSRQGYLYMMEKKAFGTAWCKYYCMYEKKSKVLTLVAFNQLNGKSTPSEPIMLRLRSCVRRLSDSIDRRFCFDITGQDTVYTLQATSEEDRRLWMDAMDGKEPTYCKPGLDSVAEHTEMDEAGFCFVTTCIARLEGRGLEEQGLYRVVGVASKVNKLVQLGRNKARFEKLSMDTEFETKTITSALKTFFRNLPEPLMTFKLHEEFIAAAKKENPDVRLSEITRLVNQLPKDNFRMLKILLQHLANVSGKSDRNLMSVSNLAVCFGPTLMRPEEETMATIIDIKFCNIVVEILIYHFYKIFIGVSSDLTSSETPVGGGSGDSPSSALCALQPGTIIAATAQPVQLTGPLDELPVVVKPSRSSLSLFPPSPVSTGTSSTAGSTCSTALRTRHLPPPYSHPPPPSYPQPLSGPCCSSPFLPAVGGNHVEQTQKHALSRSAVVKRPLHIINPAALADRIDGGSSLDIKDGATSRNSMSSSSESLSSRSSRDLHQQGKPEISNSVSPNSRGQLGINYPPSYRSQPDQRVRTLYACVGGNSSELSFDPNQIITNVRPSREPGWLQGTLNGHFGLVPENYIEYLP